MEVHGISNEPMLSASVQNTINNNGGQNFNICVTNMFFHDNYDIKFMGNNRPLLAFNVQGQDLKTYCLTMTKDKMYNLILNKIDRLVVFT